MQKKIAWGVIVVSALIGVFFAGELFGIHQSRKEDGHICKTDAIAVVNMDDGIRQEGTIVNYAVALSSLPGENFSFKGLEDARTGIVSDQLAAYIILPPSFSQDICSINSDLQKSRIRYMVNPRLEDDMRVKVQRDIQEYLETLSDNASYMYVDAILREFHQAQDDADRVMENDTNDYEMVSAIIPDNLLVAFESDGITYVDTDLQTADVEKEFERVFQNITNIHEIYQNGKEKSKEKLEEVEDECREAVDAGKEFHDYLGSASVFNNDGGEDVYKAGLEGLEEYAEKYAEDNQERMKEMEHLIGVKKPASAESSQGGESVSSGGQEGESDEREGICKKISIMQDELKEQKKALDEMKEICRLLKTSQTYNMSAVSLAAENTSDSVSYARRASVEDKEKKRTTEKDENEISEEKEDEEIGVGGTQESVTGENEAVEKDEPEGKEEREAFQPYELQKTSGEVSIEALEERLEAYGVYLTEEEDLLSLMKQDTDALYKTMNELNVIKTAELDEQIRKGIIIPIQNEINREQEKERQESEKVQEKIENYMDEMREFDPLQYIDDGKIGNEKEQMRTSAGEIQQKMDDMNSDALDYSEKVYETTEKNVEDLEQSLEKAYEQTEFNITHTLKETISAKEKWHRENLELMQSLTKKLLYSRKGELANRQMYEFIICPIETERIYLS